jgi:hypothetical protein
VWGADGKSTQAGWLLASPYDPARYYLHEIKDVTILKVVF